MSFSWTKFVIIPLLVISFSAFGGFVYWSFSELPEIRSLEGYTPIESSFIYSADGKTLAEFYMERRNFIPNYAIPDMIKKSFISIEDQRFYSHAGVDFIGILRAVFRDMMAQSIVEGGSTITQQLTKMLFLKPEKSIGRKIKEVIIAIQIEKRYTKDEILGMYLNKAYFGARAYGIEAAAQTYFDKPAGDLSLGESAMLAALQKAPSMYSPFKNPDKTLARRQLVLKKMIEMNFITQEQYERANAEPLPIKPHNRKFEAPYFVEYLRQQLEPRYGDKLYTAGMKIYSTIDYTLQKAAEQAVQNGIKELEKRGRDGVQAALVAIDPRNGRVKAMVGGTDFWETQFNRATLALRQPGSAFKPFVYGAALENGMTSSDEILDGPISFPGGSKGGMWSPKNYDGKYRGSVSLKTAIALSLNTATVRLAHNTGLNEVIAFARKCGIKSTLQPYLPIALGASDVTLLEMTSAYGVFSTGRKFDPLTYLKVMGRDGISLEEPFPVSEEVLSEDTVTGMRELLKAVVDMGTATKAKELKRPVYGKTGTTNDFSDAWFIGFDDSLVVGVWVGRDNHKPIGPKEAGGKAALPIWIDFMKSVPVESSGQADPVRKTSDQRSADHEDPE